MTEDDDAVEIPINGVLDLHTFRPCEVADVVRDYLELCREKRISSVRIIHGKGIGNLRRTVEATLKKIAWVKSWQPAGHDAGHWGATLVELVLSPDLAAKPGLLSRPPR